jgi:DNA mismatch repair protein MutS2
MERTEAEYQRKQLEEDRHRLEEERVKILNEARAQARRELESVQAEVAKIRIDARRDNLTQERLSNVRQRTRALDEKLVMEPTPQRPRQRPVEAELLEGP